ncbi:MAG: hypothetical protein KAV87_63860 [Desulfobacteraceae bacterium]|nr:hypothetical protein [Desulfobacteraceae bacterium]
MTTENLQVEKGISEIIGAITDPIIVWPGGWGEDLPEWLKTAITLERLIMNMRVIKGEEMTGTDASLHLSLILPPCPSLYLLIFLWICLLPRLAPLTMLCLLFRA